MILYCTTCAHDTHHLTDTNNVVICDDCGAIYLEELPAMERLICAHCNQEGDVLDDIPLQSRRMVRLSCGHVCTFDIGEQKEPSMGKRQGGEAHVCLGCHIRFWTGLAGPLGEFCPMCRGKYGIQTPKEAEEIVEMISLGLFQDPPEDEHEHRAFLPVKHGVVVPIRPPINPEVVAEGIRAMVDYRTLPIEHYEKPITYVTAKNGLFEVRQSDLCTMVSKPKEVLGITQEIKEGITFNLPKVPFAFLTQTIAFFRGVCEREKGTSEALVQIWWDRDAKTHVLHVPDQQVSGGSVHHTSTFDRDNEGKYFHVMDIHSHGSSMGAFWSGIDDADEKKITTERLFGVIGKVTQPIPEWKWRLSTRGAFIDLTMVEVFETPTKVFDFTVTSDILFKMLDTKDGCKDGYVMLSCPVDPFVTVDVPEEWYTHVKPFTHTPVHGGYSGAPWHERSAAMRGYVYISDREYQFEDGKLTPTGHSLITKKEEPYVKP